MGACGNRVGMGVEVEFVEKWWKRCELGKEGGWKEELKVDFAEWLGQSSNGQQGIGLGWFGQRCSNSLKAPNRTRWTRLFLLLISALGCGWCVNVKRVEEQREVQDAGRLPVEDFQDFQIQSGQLGSGKKYSVLRGTTPSCPSSPIRDRPAAKTETGGRFPVESLRLHSFFCLEVSCAQVKVRLAWACREGCRWGCTWRMGRQRTSSPPTLALTRVKVIPLEVCYSVRCPGHA